MDERKIDVSIIVPVYNAGYYLPRCLKSLITQTYKDIEIILVDDGSKDKSASICDKFAKKDKRITVIHKENAGVSVARNTGLNIAKGKWVSFVDADDWLSHNAISKLVERIETTKTDYCFGKVKNIYELSTALMGDFVSAKLCLDNYDDKLFILKNIPFGPWSKLFRLDIIRENKIYFEKEIKLNEDTIFNLEYLKHCKSVSIENSVCYYYNRMFHFSAVDKYYTDTYLWKKIILQSKLQLINEKKLSKEVMEIIEQSYVETISYYNKFLDSTAYHDIKAKITNEWLDVLKDYYKDDFELISEKLKTAKEYSSVKKHESGVKHLLRKIAKKIKEILIYKIKILYK